MFSLIFWILVGLGLFIAVPMVINRVLADDPRHDNGWSRFAYSNVARVLGVIIVLWAAASTSYVHVPDGYIGTMFKVYGGGSLPGEKIIATDGENGPQAEILPPGFHFIPFLNVFYDVDINTQQLVVPSGQLAVLNASDGKALRPGQAFGDPFPEKLGNQMLDATTFLTNGGQRGPQQTVLPPGTYRLNPYLWKADLYKAEEVAAGQVGVIKSNIHADVDLGTLKAKKPENCSTHQADEDQTQLAAPIVPVGCIGVWNESLPPGKYYFNPFAFIVTPIDTRAQVWNYAGGYTKATIDLTVDAKGDITQKRNEQQVPFDPETSADTAVAVKMEGWDVPLELRVVAQVSPEQAPCVVASVGGLKQIEDRILTPSIRSITRDVAGGSYEVQEPKLGDDGKPALDSEGKPTFIQVTRLTKVLDLINQRPLIEGEIENRIRPQAEKACVTIREVRLGEPAIPPELLVAVRREQLATQLAKAFVQEQGAQEKRIDSEKAKSTADQQSVLVKAEIEVKASEQLAMAAKNQGQGERDKLTLIAEGQKAQTTILGTEATVDLRKYELLMGNIFDFVGKNPDVLAQALTNASKFVPQVQVGGGGDATSGMLDAILGQYLRQQSVAPSAPQSAPRN